MDYSRSQKTRIRLELSRGSFVVASYKDGHRGVLYTGSADRACGHFMAIDSFHQLNPEYVLSIQRDVIDALPRGRGANCIQLLKRLGKSLRLKRLLEILNNAKGNDGRMKLRLGEFAITAAPEHGKNPGCFYISRSEDYCGRINPNGSVAIFKHEESTAQLLKELCRDPDNYIKQAGLMSGKCSCCGRGLTDPESIKAGIGPICAKNWGILR